MFALLMSVSFCNWFFFVVPCEIINEMKWNESRLLHSNGIAWNLKSKFPVNNSPFRAPDKDGRRPGLNKIFDPLPPEKKVLLLANVIVPEITSFGQNLSVIYGMADAWRHFNYIKTHAVRHSSHDGWSSVIVISFVKGFEQCHPTQPP